MNGLSLLATTISVLSFPLVFLALLYPHIASPKWGRWPGFFLYLGISIFALLIAVYSASGPNLRAEAWKATDWLVLLIGGMGILAVFTRQWWWPDSTPKESSTSDRGLSAQGPNRLNKKKTKKGCDPR